MEKTKKQIRLSPTSGLNLFQECPRCFWLHYNQGVHRPRGPFPSLPGGMDLVIKDYFDMYRGALPPEIENKISGKLIEDVKLMNQWRDWRTGLEYKDKDLNATLFGALDDCLFYNGKYAPLDYKTRGSAPREGDSEKYYQTQLDSYALLLEANSYPVQDFAYLVYYYPEKVLPSSMIKFNIKPVKLETNTARVKKIFQEAVGLLRRPLPRRHSECIYCCWNNDLLEFD